VTSGGKVSGRFVPTRAGLAVLDAELVLILTLRDGIDVVGLTGAVAAFRA
jgi:hypothetical protein